MKYTCSVCQEKVEGGLVTFTDHTEKHIVDLIKHDHPQWVQEKGACPKCVEHYRNEINGSTFKDAACAIRKRKASGLWEKIKRMFNKS